MSLIDEVRLASEALAKLRQIEADTDDEALVHDTIEGETELLPALEYLAKKARKYDDWAASCRMRAQEFEKRARRFENAQRSIRGAIAWAMQEAGLKKHQTAEVTISLKAGPRSVIITDQAALPIEYTKTTVAPDKTAIKAALSDGVDVPGATLGNGEPVLVIGV